ncbi:MAG TPA: hypothetical protein VM581_03630, partial [Magnetospirillaceae bacterium]|nr:hypothetical protein [Magnetospirillaceae bacterium]
MHLKYKLRSDSRAYLPPFVPGTTDLVAILRPNTPLACTKPETVSNTQLENRNLMGELCARLHLGRFDYQVVTQPGNQFTVAPVDIIGSEAPVVVQPYEPFRLGSVVHATPDRPIASVVSAFWSQRGQMVDVQELWRVRNALVLGRIAPGDEPDTWLSTDTGVFLIEPGSYVIQELTGRGVRIVSPTYMGREFETL